MERHRAIIIEEEGLSLGLRPTPSPRPGYLRIKVKIVAVNPMDCQVLLAGYFINSYPAVLGIDASGTVDAVGQGVNDYREGDQVFFRGHYYDPDEATFQEFCLVHSELVAKVPPGMTLEETAGVSVASFAAFVALFHPSGANIPPPFPAPFSTLNHSQVTAWVAAEYGPGIVILGGSCSVGQYLIQFARMVGFTTIIVTASAAHADYLISLGATHVLGRSTPAATIVMELLASSGGWTPSINATPVVVDAVSSVTTLQQGVDVLSAWSIYGGTVVSLSTARPTSVPQTVDVRGIFAVTSALRRISVPFFKCLGNWMEQGMVKPNRFEVVGGLEMASAAMERLQSGGVSGVKLLLRTA